MPTAVFGNRGVLSIGSGSPITYTPIAQVLSITPPNPSRQSVATSNMDTANALTFRPSALYDAGEVSMTIQFDSSAHSSLWTAFSTALIQDVQVEYGDPDGWSSAAFKGFMTAFQINELQAEDSANLEAQVTWKITGPLTLA